MLAAFLLALGFLAGGVHAGNEGPYRGRLLVDVLEELRERGLALVYSSAVVAGDLRVSIEPTAAGLRGLLDEILRPFDLRTQDGPGGAILILKASRGVGSLQGRVLSMPQAEPIVGATVRLLDTEESATTDASGRFVIRRIPAGAYDVTVEALGFSPATVTGVGIGPKSAPDLRVELSVHPAFVTVIVTPSRHSLIGDDRSATHSVTDKEINLAPAIGGDVTRVIELLPGVAAPDASAAFSSRGSVARDVSFVLDGMELYDPFHLAGFQSPFSLIDANAVDSIDFFAGGFTADRGDRHGGFLEVRTLGPSEAGGAELEIGTLNSRFAYRAPTSWGSWLVSLRGWYPELVLGTIQIGRGEENLEPRFGDIYAKAAFNLNPQIQLSAHGLFVYDRLDFQETDEEVNESVDAVTRNGYAWLRLLTSASARWTSESALSGGRIERRRNGVFVPDEAIIVRDDRDVNFLGFKHDSIWQISDRHALKAGIDARRLEAEYRYSNFPSDPAGSGETRLEPDGTTFALYAAHRARASASFTTELGVRWDRQTHTGENQVSPRFNAVWRPGERSEIRFALGRFSQSQRIHELQVEDGETRFHAAETAQQAEVSFQYLFRRGPQIRLDAYYRRLTDLRPRYENLFEPIELFPEAAEDRIRVAPTEARLRGLEILLRGAPARSWFWWVSYTLSSAEDRIDGSDVPRSWDQPHAGTFLVGYQRPDRWSVSLSGTAHTGWPTTPVLAEVTTLPGGSTEVEVVPGERNTLRFPFYFRLDFQARRSFSVGRGKLWLTLNVVNLTGRDNPCCVEDFVLDPPPAGGTDVERVFDYWLGFTPSFSVLWKF